MVSFIYLFAMELHEVNFKFNWIKSLLKIRKYLKVSALKLHVKTTAAAEKEGKFKKGYN